MTTQFINGTNATAINDDSVSGGGICTILMIMDVPKFDFSVQFPDSYQIVFWTSVFIASIFPLYSYKSIQMAKQGTLGMNADGSKVGSCSPLGIYFTGLSIFSTTLYFGIVKSLLSAFACDWSDIANRVYLLASEDVTLLHIFRSIPFDYALFCSSGNMLVLSTSHAAAAAVSI